MTQSRSMPNNLQIRVAVEEEVETWIQTCDAEQLLRNREYDAILLGVTDEVMNNRLVPEMRPTMNDADRAFIQGQVNHLVHQCLAKPRKSRFERFDRVVCKIGGEVGWAPGSIQALDEDDPQDPTAKLPYVVKLDPPVGRLISVPHDENAICRAEVCFGKASKGDLGFTLRCKPSRSTSARKRFAVGDRVACAVEDATGEYTAWDAGTVVDIDYNIEPDAAEMTLTWNFANGAGIIPYRVKLDTPGTIGTQHVFVHRDVHWLIRDLALQSPGPRQAEDGTRNLKRLVKRRRSESEVELIDQETRKVRVQAADDDDSSDEDAGAGAVAVS